MARIPDTVLCEAHLLHSATGDAASCRKKKHWWKNNQEAKGIIVEQNEGNYAVRFYLSKNEQCCHELPKVGKALILRHFKSNEKSLFITEIKDHGISRESSLTLTLSFIRDSCDFKYWEELLRGKLKVYSFHVEIEENQIVEKGPATVHLTADYICITTNDINGKFKALYFKNRRKNTVICFSHKTYHTLEIRCFEGHRETIEFQSKYFESIKDTLEFFEKNGTTKLAKHPEVAGKHNETGKEDMKKLNKQRSTENNGKCNHIENMKFRYYKSKMPGKTKEQIVDVKARVSSKPYIYSLNDVLDNSVHCLKNNESKDIYISSKELRVLRAVENDSSRCSNSGMCQIESTSNGNNFFNNNNSISWSENYVPMNFSNVSIPQLPSSRSQQSLVNCHLSSMISKPILENSDIIPRGGKEPQEMSDYLHTSKELAVECKTGPVPGALTIHLPLAVSCRNELIEPSAELSQAGGNKNDRAIHCSQLTRESFKECLPSQVSSTDLMKERSISVDYERGQKSPKRCTVEDWTPKVLPPEGNSPGRYSDIPPKILPRTFSPSLQPHFHSYENSPGIEERKTIDSSKDVIGTSMYFFGNEMERGGAWTIGVIVLQRDENDTLERLKNLENEYGRSQLTSPRSFDITSDIKISINDCIQGFGILGERSHVLQYEDMKLLGPSRWIVVEFHFVHENEDSLIFHCDIHVDPMCYRMSMQHSHFSSQKIIVVKKITRSESNSDRCNTPSHRSRLPLSARDRQELCRDLDLPSILGENWKGLAARIGLQTRDIHIIENGKQESCAEEILQILEQRFPERCTVEFLTSTFREMRRRDLIEEYFE